MIEDYPTYKRLHRSLAYYGLKRLLLKNKVLNQSTRVESRNNVINYNNLNSEDDIRIYSQDKFCSDIFTYNNRFNSISEMSEYI